MKALITGATGYIGGRLLGSLLDSGWEAVAIVHPADAAELPSGVHRIVDPGTATALADELSPHAPEVAFHLAASQDLTDSPSASDALVDANLAFGARTLAAARAAGARAFVAAGTYSAHADGTAAYVPQTLYAATKQAFADLAVHYGRNTDMRTVVLELSDTYGPGDTRRKFLNLIAEAAATGVELDATPGEQVVRPLHVDDIVAAFQHAAALLIAGTKLHAAHAVAGAEAVSLRELVTAFEAATGRRVPIRWGARPYRPGEIMLPYHGDPLPGWAPRVSLAEGLAGVYADAASR